MARTKRANSRIDVDELSGEIYSKYIARNGTDDIEGLAKKQGIKVCHTSSKKKSANSIYLKPSMTIGEVRVAVADRIARKALKNPKVVEEFKVSADVLDDVVNSISMRILFEPGDWEKVNSEPENNINLLARNKVPKRFSSRFFKVK